MNTTNKLLLLSASILLAIGLASCSKKPAETAGKAVDQTIDQTREMMSNTARELDEQSDEMGAAFDDTAITTKIKTAILAEPGLKVLQIHVDTMNGVATLTGTVDSQRNFDKAEKVASAVSGVKMVDNQLRVTPTM